MAPALLLRLWMRIALPLTLACLSVGCSKTGPQSAEGDAPALLETVPASPTRETQVSVRGHAPAGATVLIFDNERCEGRAKVAVYAGADGAFAHPFELPDNATLRLSARLNPGVSCSAPLDAVHDTRVQPPLLEAITEGNSWRLQVSAAEPGSVDLFRGDDCAGTAFSQQSIEDTSAAGALSVTDGAASWGSQVVSAKLTDRAGNVSECSIPAGGPARSVSEPKILALGAPSPMSAAAPLMIHGLAQPKSLVRAYASASCTGSPLAEERADAREGAFRLMVDLSSPDTYVFTVQSEDRTGLLSACSAPSSQFKLQPGTGWSEPIAIPGDAKVAFDDSGSVIAVQRGATSLDVRRHAAGQWSDTVALASYAATEKVAGVGVAAAADGNAAVVWVERAGANRVVRARRFVPATGWSAAETLVTVPSIATDAVIDVLVGNGGRVLARAEFLELDAAFTFVPGRGWGDRHDLVAPRFPKLAMGSAGHAALVWTLPPRDGNPHSVQLRLLAPGGTWATFALPITGADFYHQTTLISPTGAVILAGQKQYDALTTVSAELLRFDNVARTWTPEPLAVGDAYSLSVAPSGGNPVLSYFSIDGTRSLVFRRNLAWTGASGAPELVLTRDGPIVGFQHRLTASGELFLLSRTSLGMFQVEMVRSPGPSMPIDPQAQTVFLSSEPLVPFASSPRGVAVGDSAVPSDPKLRLRVLR
jgi:hypothetical protein